MALYYRSRRRKIFFFIIFPLIIILILLYIFFQITPIFINLSEDKVYSVTFDIINNVIGNELEKIDTKNLVEYKYDSTGKIVAVNANISIMNHLNNKISEEVSKALLNVENIFIEIPLGSLMGSNFLSGVGPKLPVQIVLLNNVTTKYNTEFSSTGINQTIHRIFIDVNCNVGVLSSLVKNEQTVTVEIPIAETIIVGNVPTTYFDFYNN